MRFHGPPACTHSGSKISTRVYGNLPWAKYGTACRWAKYGNLPDSCEHIGGSSSSKRHGATRHQAARAQRQQHHRAPQSASSARLLEQHVALRILGAEPLVVRLDARLRVVGLELEHLCELDEEPLRDRIGEDALVPELRWDEVRWAELRWDEVRWAELRWDEVRWAELRWDEGRWAELRWDEVRWAEGRWDEGRGDEIRLQMTII
jgi:hypothetical protein